MTGQKASVLVVDDDVRTVRMIKRILELEGYRVAVAGDGETALAMFEQVEPQLVLLDIMMPDLDGYATCRRLREFSDVPVIMVTARNDDREIVEGLDTGADDYITKPFSAGELAARVKAVLRRSQNAVRPVQPVFELNDLKIDFASRRVTIGGREVKLTATEYRLLAYFSRNAGRIVTPDQLLDNIWGEQYLGSPHLLQVNIARLRKKMGEDARHPAYILTRPGIGYLMAREDAPPGCNGPRVA
jgi:two-component system KDP operon response regulator KdpE